MKRMIKVILLIALASSVGIIYAIANFTKLLEDVDFFYDEEEE